MTAYSASQDIIFRESSDEFRDAAGSVTGAPKAFLRLEGSLILAASALAYLRLGFDWKLFGLLFLAPDLSMLGYLAGPKIGAISYNLVHTYALPLALGLLGLMLPLPFLQAVSLIFAAHIGFDRMLAYGLKYPTGFRNTHLGRA